MTSITAQHAAKLTRTEQQILDFIVRSTPVKYAYNLCSVKKIMAAVRCSKRVVELAWLKFKSLGILERVTGDELNELRDRHGLRSTIRAATKFISSAPRERAKFAPPEAQILRPRLEIPPDPPNRRELIEDEGLRRPSPSSGSPKSGEGKGPEGEGEPPLAPPEVLAAAAAAFGAGPVIEAKARAAAAAYPAAWVLEAIRIAAAKLKPWKYARGVLQNFGREGGPEPELPAVAARRAADARIEAERQERLARMRAAPEPEGKPDEETMGYLRETAADPRHPWCERAKRDLAKWTASVPADSVTPAVPADISGDC